MLSSNGGSIMNKLNLRKILSVAGLGSLVLITAAFAGGGCRFGSPEKRAQFIIDRISGELELNTAQEAKLGEIKDEILAARKEHREERQGMVKQLIALVEAPELDKKGVQDLIAKKRDHVDRVSPKIIALVAEFHKTLTAEQRKLAGEKIAYFVERRHRE